MTTKTPDIDRIPHRAPFRFVDEVVEVADDRIITSYRADPAAEFFKGHYPGNPIMPGVLISEACFQAGALLMALRDDGESAAGTVPVLTRIQDARFKRIVKPRETLRIEVALDESIDNAVYMTGKVTVDGQQVLRVSFCCMLVKAEEPAP